jgi:quinol-cytochrome oxidoreductase complex cytochrome b subunit
LGWFFYWIVIVSGIYVYVFFDTGVTQAYQSVEHMTHAQWYAGGIMRSLHRYASDALVIVMMAHLVREFAMDRYRGKRWFAWLTGIPLLWLVYGCGISGYWLVGHACQCRHRDRSGWTRYPSSVSPSRATS